MGGVAGHGCGEWVVGVAVPVGSGRIWCGVDVRSWAVNLMEVEAQTSMRDEVDRSTVARSRDHVTYAKISHLAHFPNPKISNVHRRTTPQAQDTLFAAHTSR